MPRITISYRRDDSGVITGRIFDRLAAHYGRESVFRDIDNIPPGVDFRKHIDEMLDASDIVLAIVGPKWVGPRANQSRLANAADPVRVEIETALRKDRPVIPVLVLRAAMPRVEQLPESMQDFAYRHAVDVDASRDFDHHMTGLIRAMDGILGISALPKNDSDLVSEALLSRDIPPETDPSTSELGALRETNRALQEQVAAIAAARDRESQTAAKLRQEIAAALLHGEQQATLRSQQLAAARQEAASGEQRLEEALVAAQTVIEERDQQLVELRRDLATPAIRKTHLCNKSYERLVLLAFLGNYLVNNIVAGLASLVPVTQDSANMMLTAQYSTFVALAVLTLGIISFWYLVDITHGADIKYGILFGLGGLLTAIVTSFVTGVSAVLIKKGEISAVVSVLPNFLPHIMNKTTIVLAGVWIIPPLFIISIIRSRSWLKNSAAVGKTDNLPRRVRYGAGPALLGIALAGLLAVVVYNLPLTAPEAYQRGAAALKKADYSEAMRWYKIAAEEANAAAQTGIGALYHNGQGVPRDYDQAMNWYRKGADKGDSAAQANIGILYENGLGVSKDLAEARQWYKKAADQGLESAKAALARLDGK